MLPDIPTERAESPRASAHPGEDAEKANFATSTFTSYWPGNQPGITSSHKGLKRPRSATVVVTRKDGGTIGI